MTKLKQYDIMGLFTRKRVVFYQYFKNLVGRIGTEEMSGTKAGGMKAAATNKAKYGKEFYARIGKKGGQNGHTGGFAANPALARIAGAKGGRISRRGPAKKA